MLIHINFLIKAILKYIYIFISAGKWKVLVRTNEQPASGTSARVYIVVYGDKKDTGKLDLAQGDRGVFSSGSVNEFEVQNSFFTFIGQISFQIVLHGNKSGQILSVI